MVEITAVEQNKEKKRLKKMRTITDNIKYTNIHIIGIPEGGEREKVSEKIYEEIIGIKFCKMRKSRKHREPHAK